MRHEALLIALRAQTLTSGPQTPSRRLTVIKEECTGREVAVEAEEGMLEEYQLQGIPGHH
jgi:hypothetical protein